MLGRGREWVLLGGREQARGTELTTAEAEARSRRVQARLVLALGWLREGESSGHTFAAERRSCSKRDRRRKDRRKPADC